MLRRGEFALGLVLAGAVAASAANAPRMTVTRFSGEAGAGWEDGAGEAARFRLPLGAAADRAGNVFVTDSGNHTIRKIAPDGRVTTFAGLAGSAEHRDGIGGAARFRFPHGIGIDTRGFLYVADEYGPTIRRISPAGEVTTWAGRSGSGGTGDGVGTDARFRNPAELAVAPDGTVYVHEFFSDSIRKIGPDRRVTTIRLHGAEWEDWSTWKQEISLACDSAGTLFATYYGAGNPAGYVFRIDADGTAVPVIVGGVSCGWGCWDDLFPVPRALTLGADGAFYVASSTEIFRIAAPGEGPVPVASARRLPPPEGRSIPLSDVRALAVAPDGTLIAVEPGADAIRRVDRDGIVAPLAGRPDAHGLRDGDRNEARLSFPSSLAVSADGSLLVGDSQYGGSGGEDFRIRVVDRNGAISTLLRAPANGFAVRGEEVAVSSGTAIHRLVGGRLELLAGSPTEAGSGDGDFATARFRCPGALAFSGPTLYVAESCQGTIRKIDAARVTTVAGVAGELGSVDGPPGSARFEWPGSLLARADGSVLVADESKIRRLAPGGFVTTLFGQESGYEDGTADGAAFGETLHLAADRFGNEFVLDGGNGALRRLERNGTVRTLAGPPRGPGGWLLTRSAWTFDESGDSARLAGASAIAAAEDGSLFVAGRNGVRHLTWALPDSAVAVSPFCPRSEVTLGVESWSGEPVRWELVRAPSASNAPAALDGFPEITFVPDVDDVFEWRATTTTGVESSVTRVRVGPGPAGWIELPEAACGELVELRAHIDGGATDLRWYRNGEHVPGDGEETLKARDVSPDETFTFSAEAECGLVTAPEVRIPIAEMARPTISGLPARIDVPLGSRVELTPVVTGSRAAPRFAWWRRLEIVSTQPALVLPSVTSADLGTWTLHAANLCGTRTFTVELRIK